MFLYFTDSNEKTQHIRSAYVSFEYCKLKQGTPLKKILNLKNIPHQTIETLYVPYNDLDRFALKYRDLLGKAVYQNESEGLYDECGINYFKPERITQIIDKISFSKPTEYKIILQWLEKAKEYNGFYLLGL